MKKLILILSVMLLSACGDKDVKLACVFEPTKIEAPAWVCDETVPGIMISAVGVSDFSKLGTAYMKDIATVNARAVLADRVSAKTTSIINSSLKEKVNSDDESIDKRVEIIKKSKGYANLIGSKILKSRLGPNKKYYVLVGVDKKEFKRIQGLAKKVSEAEAKRKMKDSAKKLKQDKKVKAVKKES